MPIFSLTKKTCAAVTCQFLIIGEYDQFDLDLVWKTAN